MHRFFTDRTIINGEVDILGDDFKHISKVLRITENEKIEVVVNEKLYTGNVEILSDRVRVFNLELQDYNSESNVNIHLLQCLVKGEKMDFIIQKSVELGVKDIRLINSKRCVVKFDNKKEAKKIERYQKISYEAAKQSKRLIIPKILDTISINEIPNLYKNEVILVAYENNKDYFIKNVVSKIKNETDVKDIFILVGSEGGFEDEEVKYLVDNGVVSVGLGPRILRAETAGIAMISMLQYEFM